MILIGVAGGSASGKSTLVERLIDRLGSDSAAVITHDRYYRDRGALEPDMREALNYDHPDALETELLLSHLQSLRMGLTIEAPVYDFSRHARELRVDRIEPRPVIFLEGLLVLADARLRDAVDLRVFVDTDDETRYLRRLKRDVEQRGRTMESVRAQYAATVGPMHRQFVEPSRRYADLLVVGDGFPDAWVEPVLSEIMKRRGL